MLFGLFFWEVMFADVDDVFQSPYQTYPLDLFTSWFVRNRKEWIESLLNKLKQQQPKN
jgi:Fanconi-associated nuclease 1